jgi:DNA polymerase III subunit alpha
VLDEQAGNMPTYFRFAAGEHYLVYQLEHAYGSHNAIATLNRDFAWAQAMLAYDQQTILSRFAPKPPAWAQRAAAAKGMQA